ncbi:MAG: N-acetylmuramoyl-L-alanine amidase [Flavobacteriales bacterium]
MTKKIFSTLLFIFSAFLLFGQTAISPLKTEDWTQKREVPAQRFIFANLLGGHEYSVNLVPQKAFSCLGLGWKINAAPVQLRDLNFSYRTLSPEGVWSVWLEADADFAPDETPTQMYWTDLLFTHDASSHTAIEIRLSSPVPVQELILDVFDGNTDPNPNHGLLKHEEVDAGARNCPAFPAIIPRGSWCGGSAPCASVNAAYSVTYISPTHVVMHHGASPNTYTDGQAVVRSYWNYHVNTLGWIDIGYNYLIDKYGNFYQGRRNPNLPTTDVRGAHAGNANSGSIGMNFLGNLDVSIATTPQLNKLHEFLAWWFNHKSYDPLSSAGMQTQAYGWQTQPRFTHHNAIGQTSCPGTDMISRMSLIRTATKAIIDACSIPADTDPPTTAVQIPYDWRSHDFWVYYNDEDPPGGTGVDESYYQVLDYNGTEWRANTGNGFFNDNFNTAIHSDWTVVSGTWLVSNGRLVQSDEAVGNTNIYASLVQNNQQAYLYQWNAYISGSGTNRRSGLHFFVDNPNLPNRGNSYLAWFRADDNKFQFYKVVNDNLNLVVDNNLTVPANQWIDCKVTYNPTTGAVQAYMNNQLVGTYTDPTPIQAGGFISLRNGDSDVQFDDLKVRLSRNTQTFVTVGSQGTKDARYESSTNQQDACRINTIVKDGAGNWSTPHAKHVYIDWTEPTTSSTVTGNWQIADFTVNFTDSDNANGSGLARRFYQVIDFDGVDWRANSDRGFFSDNFDLALHPDWIVVSGTWNTNGGVLEQTDVGQNNTNIYAPLNQNLSNRYLYNFQLKIDGTGSNRRAGFHYFCDQPNLTNRGNSYFVWFRIELQTLEFYKVTNDTFTQEKVMQLITNPGQWYDISVVYDRVTGETFVYRDNKLVGEWQDTSPLFNGDYISFRSGNSHMAVNNLKVYRTRTASTTVTVGQPTSDIRYQNPNPLTFAAKVKSIVADTAHNLSQVHYHNLNIDWTPPATIASVFDGQAADIDTFYTPTQLSANWMASTDAHSDVVTYWFSIGTSAGATDVLGWTNVGNITSYTANGLTLVNNQLYYVNLKAENGAGLESAVTSSDGQRLINTTGLTDLENEINLAVYPNPFVESVFIEWNMPQPGKVAFSLFDAQGKVIRNIQVREYPTGTHKQEVLFGRELAQGVYLLELTIGEQKITRKLIK